MAVSQYRYIDTSELGLHTSPSLLSFLLYLAFVPSFICLLVTSRTFVVCWP
jgi:hypothetical protein